MIRLSYRPELTALFPNREYELDRSHQLADRLVFLYVPGIAHRNIVNNNNLVSSTAVDYRGPSGILPYTTGGIAVRNITLPLADTTELNFTSPPWTVALRGYLLPGANELGINLWARSRYVSEANNQGWEIASNNSAPGNYHFRVFNNNGSGNYVWQFGSENPRPAGLHYMVCYVTPTATAGHLISPTGNFLFSSGARNKTAASNTAGTGCYLNVNGVTEQHPLYVAYAWNRQLTTDEIQWLYREPLPFMLDVTPKSFIIGNRPSGGPLGGPGGGSVDIDVALGGSVGGSGDAGVDAGAGEGSGAGEGAGEGTGEGTGEGAGEAEVPAILGVPELPILQFQPQQQQILAVGEEEVPEQGIGKWLTDLLAYFRDNPTLALLLIVLIVMLLLYVINREKQ